MDKSGKNNETNADFVLSPPSAGPSEPASRSLSEQHYGITLPNMRPSGGAPGCTQTIDNEFKAYTEAPLSPTGMDKLIFWKASLILH